MTTSYDYLIISLNNCEDLLIISCVPAIRPGILKQGFLEEAWSEQSLQGKVRFSQANKEKRAFRAEEIA